MCRLLYSSFLGTVVLSQGKNFHADMYAGDTILYEKTALSQKATLGVDPIFLIFLPLINEAELGISN